MEWRDEGILLTTRKHGETSAILEVFTAGHGRHAGVLRGATSRRMAPALQPGTQLALDWRARLEDHIGSYRAEPVKMRAGRVMGDRAALSALASVCALLAFTLPERAPHPALYLRSCALLDGLGETRDWTVDYLRWELALLEEMGFGPDLTACAVTGATEGLIYVSPKSGRAVSAAGAGDWAGKLLPLPACLFGAPARGGDVAAGLRMTGHFLDTWLAPALGDRPLPEARHRFARLMDRRAAGGAR